ISSSRFIGGHDDPINVHGTHLQIIGTPAPDQLHLQFMHPQSYGFDAFFPDDEIEFVRSSSLAAYAGNVVKAVKAVNPREILLTLSEPAPEGIMPGDVVENITWTPEVEITNNYFARVPTRGVLVTTRRRVVIENNHFERMTMSGVLVADDAESWYESGRVKDIAIRGNRFIECGSSSNPVIYIAPENTEVHADKPVHANIRVEGNYFLTADAAVLGAKSTRQLSFTHNEVSLIGESSAIPDIIRLRACSEVTIADNSFSGGGADHKHIRIQDMKRDTLAVSPEQSLPVIG
ncbi:right-handed parallel beta-helix repeat-containing protein, partial [Paenibacillus sepulcri]|nr:right-handed parallel beta-helix repeat-containing protein [Paenibacillus sepulcri]